jgi:Domain of unknown function (DUF4251)
MKQLFYYLFIPVLFTGIIISGCSGSKQTAASNFSREAIADAINNNEWVFTANFMMPQSGRSRATNGLYTVTCSGNKFAVGLPYFGRAYTAQLGSSKGPLDFNTADFDVTKEEKKEGQWLLVLKPKDYKEVQTMNFTLYDNGSASLDVTFTNRSPISFSGNIAPKK